MTLRLAGAAFVGIAMGASGVAAQSLNVDFGLAADAPASTYAAAGLPGVWNSVEGEDSPRQTYPLVGLDGAPTGATLYNIGGTDLLSGADPSVSGDDAALMNDALLTYTSSLETCLFVNGLEPGTYEVTMYAWMPSAPAVQSRVRHDLDTRTEDVGGAWPGAHVEGVTYARHVLVIGSDGILGSHSGIVPGMSESLGAALNGFQLRRLDCTGPCDAGPTLPDAATSPDAGARVDAGTAPTDAGVARDAGAPAAGGGCSIARSRPGASVLAWLALAVFVRRRAKR